MVDDGFDLSPYGCPGGVDAVAGGVLDDKAINKGETIGFECETEGAGFDDLPAFVGEVIAGAALSCQREIHVKVAVGGPELLGMDNKEETKGNEQCG